MTESGRAAWACPGCGFMVGWIDEDNNLVIWRYPSGFLSIRCGVFVCGCGAVIQWREAMAPKRLDKDSAAVVQ